VVVNLPPKPVADADTQPFWDAARQQRLVVQRCHACEAWIWQPKPVCNKCRARNPVWTDVPGDARVASWTVLHPPVLPVWQDKVPFTVLLVELEEAPGVRMVGPLVNDRGDLVRGDDGLAFGARVSLRWRTDEAGTVLPAWSLG
jgi:hypothetical protein